VPRILALGSSGPDVADLQNRLNNRPPTNFPPLRADGIFGPKTQQRLLEFQRNNGLKADGLAGPITFAALEGSLSNVKRSGIDCGTGDPSAVNGGQMIAFAFGRTAAQWQSTRRVDQRSWCSVHFRHQAAKPVRHFPPELQSAGRYPGGLHHGGFRVEHRSLAGLYLGSCRTDRTTVYGIYRRTDRRLRLPGNLRHELRIEDP